MGNEHKNITVEDFVKTSPPDIAGVSTPSPIAIQVPNRTKTSSPLRNLGCLSKNDFRAELCHVSVVPSVTYSDNFSSVIS